MKYKYYLSVLQCNRDYSDFMRAMDLGITDVGINMQMSFITDKEPNQENIEKIEKLLNSTQQEKSLKCYYRNVKFIKAEVVMEK